MFCYNFKLIKNCDDEKTRHSLKKASNSDLFLMNIQIDLDGSKCLLRGDILITCSTNIS
jgi:hypothetical protein